MSEITRILNAVQSGDTDAADALLPIIYDELRKLAAIKMTQEYSCHTLEPTELVHEAWLRLTANPDARWENRTHFFGAAGEAMRRILIEQARRKNALKRGAGVEWVYLDEVDTVSDSDDDTVLIVNDALDKLELEDPRAAKVVKLRFLVGMTNAEAGRKLGISERSVKRRWTSGRDWLRREIQARS